MGAEIRVRVVETYLRHCRMLSRKRHRRIKSCRVRPDHAHSNSCHGCLFQENRFIDDHKAENFILYSLFTTEFPGVDVSITTIKCAAFSEKERATSNVREKVGKVCFL